MIRSDWHSCYSEGWQGIIVPEAFAHPAKFSRALIRRIYEHMLEESWVQAGDTVLDPFGGVALGAWPALRLGLNWLGVELEQKFVDLGNRNIALWNETYSQHLPNWGRAVLLQGDSQRLAEVVGWAGACVSSPPYAGAISSDGSGIDWSKRKAGAYTGDSMARKRAEELAGRYGTHPAQLGNLPEGSLADALVSSPPWSDSLDRGVVDKQKRVELARAKGISNAEHISPIDMENEGLRTQPDYGQTAAQLAAMPEGEFDACLSSPPYEGSIDHAPGNKHLEYGNGVPGNLKQVDYGTSEGQIGIERGDTFWSAARTIVQQVYQVLAPGAPAVWVVKSFVRNKRRVDFPNQWRELCEACGFESLHWHRAHLVENRGSQFDLFGELHENRVERKSFFRRLAERKGSPRIDWEVVLCTRKGS